MTLDQEDIEAIAESVAIRLNAGGCDEIKVEDAMRILAVNRRTICNIARLYPEIKPGGKGTHLFSRAACLRVAWIRRNRASGKKKAAK